MTPNGDLPAIGEFITAGLLRLQRADGRMLRDSIAAARTDIEAAISNQRTFPSWSAAMLYEAGLRGARVIVQAAGYRIAADRGHVTAIDAADVLTHGRHRVLFVRLHRMRRQRHDFMYDIAPEPSESDLELWRNDVEKILVLAEDALEKIE